MQRLLVAHDLTDGSRFATGRSIRLAAKYGAAIRFVHVPPGSTSEDERLAARKRLQTKAGLMMEELVGRDLDLSFRTAFGDPAEAIVKEAERFDADLILVGAHGEPRFRDAIFGTTTMHLVRHSPRPILVAQNDDSMPYAKLMAAVDGVSAAEGVLRVALELAPEGEIFSTHAFEPEMSPLLSKDELIEQVRSDQQLALERVVQHILPAGANPSVRSHAIVEEGEVVRVIMDSWARIKPDLVVMATHGRVGIFASAPRQLRGLCPARLHIRHPCDADARHVGIARMTAPTLTVHGAARTVTGSCFEIGFGRHRILIDCGLFQGSRSLEALNREKFAFDPRQIDAVLLTHAHLDHSGLLPRLVAEGFKGIIWATRPTIDLLAVMLPDAAHIHEQEVERRNRRADRADEPPIEPLYTLADAEKAVELARPAVIEEQYDAVPGLQARFWNAGHILGSASVEIVAGGVRLLFSGDLGPENKSFHLDPSGPRGLDHVLCESTYGDRNRETGTIEQRQDLLEAEVKRALARGGNLVIPVFALERTQELLLDLARLMNKGRLPNGHVFIDSPLASRATEVFRRYQGELEDLGDGEVFRHPAFHYVQSVEESMRLNSVSGAIILAASGMCEGGRIRHHLRYNLPRGDSTILFVGFQAQGMLGRTILEGAGRVRISGQDVAVRAQIRRIDNYSAHADRQELIDWVKARQPILGSLFLTHGEAGAIEALRTDLEGSQASVIVPEIGERYALAAGAPARRLSTGRTDLSAALSRDWQNDYADLAVNLKRQLQRIESGERRAEAIARMRSVLDQYADHRRKRRQDGKKETA